MYFSLEYELIFFAITLDFSLIIRKNIATLINFHARSLFMNGYYSPLTDTFVGANILLGFYQFLPRLLGSILVFLIGLVLGKWLRKIVVRILESVNLSKLATNTTFEKFLKRADVKSKIEEIIGTALQWLLVLVFIVTAINILGIPTISELLNSILAYIPRVVSAIFVLGIGTLLAGVIESLVKGTVGQFDIKTSRLLGKIASYIMMIFAAMAAFNELGIAKEFINILFVGFVSMLSLGFGLAIGLGAKDVVADLLGSWYKRFRDDVRGEKSKK
jgi:hypothetical protein